MTTNTELATEIGHIGEKVDDIHKVIYGNGEPRNSLVVRFALVEAFAKDAKKIMWIAVGAAVTSVIGLVVTLSISGT